MTEPKPFSELPTPKPDPVLLMIEALQAQTAAIVEQTAAMKDLTASNRTLAKAMLDIPEDEAESETYLDGTPK